SQPIDMCKYRPFPPEHGRTGPRNRFPAKQLMVGGPKRPVKVRYHGARRTAKSYSPNFTGRGCVVARSAVAQIRCRGDILQGGLPMIAMESLVQVFAQVQDPRKPRGVRHPMESILALVFLGLLARI